MPTTTTGTMKAVHIHEQGGPEVLRFEDVPRPEPGAQEVLVRIQAAGVNPVDWKIREGHLGKIALPAIMGLDFSGEVEALGPEVMTFASASRCSAVWPMKAAATPNMRWPMSRRSLKSRRAWTTCKRRL